MLAGCNSSSAIPQPRVTAAKPIQHVIIMMQENRSFNNIFAGFPGADTALTGACEPAKWCKTGTITLKPVTLESTDKFGLGTDIDHSHNGFKIECNLKSLGVCQNDGFDKIRFGEAGGGELAKTYPYQYVERSETKAYWDFAKRYALADHMFFTRTAASFISHQIRFAERLRERRKSNMAIITAVMRKLLTVAYGVLKSGQFFDPNYANP
jgi:phospholipase C